jgi:hypothetical protein
MFTNYANVKDMSSEVLAALFEGGPGSGNWGHKGRPGRRGGSLPTKVGSIARALAKSEKGGLRVPKLSGKLWRAARTARNIEVIASGSPMKMLKRLINILVGRKIVSKLYR